VTGLEFLSATIGQLVWPLLIVTLILILKEPLKRLAVSPRLAKLKAGPSGIELEFNEELRDVERELQEQRDETTIEPRPSDGAIASEFLKEMTRLAEVSPRSVVMETHVRLEKLIRDSVDVQDIAENSAKFISMRNLARLARQQSLVTKAEASVLDELTYLRNRIAHEPDEVITSDTALKYAELATQIAIAIRISSGQTALDSPPL
jgi:hypothetical protein